MANVLFLLNSEGELAEVLEAIGTFQLEKAINFHSKQRSQKEEAREEEVREDRVKESHEARGPKLGRSRGPLQEQGRSARGFRVSHGVDKVSHAKGKVALEEGEVSEDAEGRAVGGGAASIEEADSEGKVSGDAKAVLLVMGLPALEKLTKMGLRSRWQSLRSRRQSLRSQGQRLRSSWQSLSPARQSLRSRWQRKEVKLLIMVFWRGSSEKAQKKFHRKNFQIIQNFQRNLKNLRYRAKTLVRSSKGKLVQEARKKFGAVKEEKFLKK